MRTEIRTLEYKKASDTIFYTAYAIYLAALILNSSLFAGMDFWPKCYGIVRYAAYMLICVKLVMGVFDKRYSVKNVCVFGVVAAIFAGVALSARDKTLFILWMFIAAGFDTDFRKIIKLSLAVHICCMILIVGAALLGIIENRLFIQGDRQRYGLGYIYTTHISNYFFHMILMFIYLKKDRLNWVETAVLAIINVVIFWVTDTKYPFILGFVVLIGAWAVKKFQNKWKDSPLYSFAVIWCVPILAFVTIVGIISYQETNPLYSFVNELVTGRIRLGHMGYQQLGIRLLGQPVQWQVVSAGGAAEALGGFAKCDFYVDSSYMQILLNYGLLTIILVCTYFVSIGKVSIDNKDVYLGGVMLIIAIHSIFDPQLIWLAYNPFVFAVMLEEMPLFGREKQG